MVGGGRTFGINSNRAYDDWDSGGHLAATLDCGESDGDIQVTLATFADQMGLAFRLSGDNDFLFLAAYSGSGYSLYERVGGSSSSLGTYVTTPASGDVIKVTFSGSSLEVFVNGVSRFTATSSFNLTKTEHGLWAYGASGTAARWDDFSFTGSGGGGFDPASGFPWSPTFNPRPTPLKVVCY